MIAPEGLFDNVVNSDNEDERKSLRQTLTRSFLRPREFYNPAEEFTTWAQRTKGVPTWAISPAL